MNTFKIRPKPPFQLELTVWALRRVQVNEMDRWDGRTYSRVLIIPDADPAELSVIQTGPPDDPEITINTTADDGILSDVNRLLGLDVDMEGFYRLAEMDSQLSALANSFMGIKPPRLPSVFEALVNAITCQQISLIAGIHILNRLTASYGVSVGDYHAFPRPQDLLGVSVNDLKRLGFSGRKAEYILSISEAIVDGRLDLNALERLDDASVTTSLCELRGVGRWTAEYVALRGLGRLNVYPADDIGNRAILKRWLNLADQLDYDGVHRIIDKWSPYRGLIYLHLLLENQFRSGLFRIPE